MSDGYMTKYLEREAARQAHYAREAAHARSVFAAQTAAPQVSEEERYRQTVRAYADVIRARPWDFFVTLTFSFSIPLERAVEEISRKYLRRLHQRAGRGVSYFLVLERSPQNGRWHVHGLIGNSGRLTARDLQDAWKAGALTDVRLYNPELGGVEYMLKTVLSEEFFELHSRDVFAEDPSRMPALVNS